MLPMRLLRSNLLLALLVLGTSAKKLKTVYEWKYIEFLWENELARKNALAAGDYNYTKPIIIDVDTWKDGRVFVTLIRDEGVPASLATVSDIQGHGGPLLTPYPNWSWAKKGDCMSITSVYRVAIDECDRLWVLDNGQIGDEEVCPPQLLVFDLHTDHLLNRIVIPKNISHNAKTKRSLLVTPIVETEGLQCAQTHVYIADVLGNAVIVFNGKLFRRLESPVMSPLATAADVEIAGETFNLPDSIIGMALSPKTSYLDPRHLLFRPFASHDMVSVENWNLQESVVSGLPVHYSVASNVLPSPAVAMAFSNRGVIFFGLTTQMALACWNVNLPISKENIVIVDQDSVTHQFASGLKVVPQGGDNSTEKIWMVTNRFQKIMQGTQDFTEINFRVMTGYVDELIAGTNCDLTSLTNP